MHTAAPRLVSKAFKRVRRRPHEGDGIGFPHNTSAVPLFLSASQSSLILEDTPTMRASLSCIRRSKRSNSEPDSWPVESNRSSAIMMSYWCLFEPIKSKEASPEFATSMRALGNMESIVCRNSFVQDLEESQMKTLLTSWARIKKNNFEPSWTIMSSGLAARKEPENKGFSSRCIFFMSTGFLIPAFVAMSRCSLIDTGEKLRIALI
mmetsp:Transcript_36879/g.82963  ORF Transcript_36879/g.82963 Transcript_36879/m.82963 type:complete len:207 (-) Transcript_36879:706-1326(-)